MPTTVIASERYVYGVYWQCKINCNFESRYHLCHKRKPHEPEYSGSLCFTQSDRPESDTCGKSKFPDASFQRGFQDPCPASVLAEIELRFHGLIMICVIYRQLLTGRTHTGISIFPLCSTESVILLLVFRKGFLRTWPLARDRCTIEISHCIEK